MPLFVGRVEDSVFGSELRERREEVGLSQAELGLIAGVHRGTIRNAEAGRPLEARTATNVLRALGCTWLRSSTDGDDGVIADPGVWDVLSVRLTRNITRAILDLPDDDHESFEKLVTDYFEVVAAAAQAREYLGRAVKLRESAQDALDASSAAMAEHLSKFGPDNADYAHLLTQHAEFTNRLHEADRDLRRGQDIPVSVERLRAALERVLPAHQLRDFDIELQGTFGEKYQPPRPGAAKVDVPVGSGKSATIVEGLGRGLGALIPKMPVLSDVQLIIESGLPDDVKQQLMDHMSTRRAETEETLRRELKMLIEQLNRMPGNLR